MHVVVDPVVIDGAIIGFMVWAVAFILSCFNAFRGYFRVSPFYVEVLFLVACIGLGASIGWFIP